ncbi:MAG TPA: protease complex subunit PrcB family protein [Fimbriimonadaceae bacterium]|nr:protease complex subunit PrcB family protein [Fimbriimonadaceae bacterium]
MTLAIALTALALSALPQSGIKWRGYKSGTYSSVQQESRFIINNQAEFERYWSTAFGESASKTPKDVKWGEEMLVAVHLGTKSTGGFSCFVQSIERAAANTILVTYCERSPGPGMMAPTVITSPFEIVRMNRAGGNFEFKKTTAQTGGFQPQATSSWRVFITGNDSRVERETQYVITNNREWQTYWGEHSPTKIAAPQFDFEREWLIALHLGTKATDGYDVIVTGVEPLPNASIGINYLVRQPASGQIVSRTRTEPFTIIRVPKFAGKVFYERRIWDNSGE